AYINYSTPSLPRPALFNQGPSRHPVLNTEERWCRLLMRDAPWLGTCRSVDLLLRGHPSPRRTGERTQTSLGSWDNGDQPLDCFVDHSESGWTVYGARRLSYTRAGSKNPRISVRIQSKRTSGRRRGRRDDAKEQAHATFERVSTVIGLYKIAKHWVQVTNLNRHATREERIERQKDLDDAEILVGELVADIENLSPASKQHLHILFSEIKIKALNDGLSESYRPPWLSEYPNHGFQVPSAQRWAQTPRFDDDSDTPISSPEDDSYSL
ncbi:hypothetical protein FA13DRAFT_1722726, partial [Coprinellus micaceus]